MSLSLTGFVSLRTRFILIAVLLTVAFSTVWGVWVWKREQALLRERIDREGTMLVSAMAIPIINALLYEELGIIEEGGLLDNFVADIMANTQLQPRYVFVTDLQGKILTHNVLSEYGAIYDDPLTLAVLVSPGLIVQPVSVDREPLLDFGMPLAISGKRWGSLRVGVSLLPLRQEMQKLAIRISGFTLLFAFGALAAFVLIGDRLSRPLVKLAGAMERVPDLTHDYQPEALRRDEIGQLQQSFSRLLERLNRMEQERDKSVDRLLDNERLATIGKLVSGVAHEVNNPLAGIEGAMFHLRKSSNTHLRKYIDVVQREVDRIGGIVRQLLDLARAGRLEVEQVSSQAFFNEIDSFSRMALKPLGVVYLSKNLCKLDELHIDRDKLYQVVLNLVLNAADAASEGSEGEAQVELLVYDSPDGYCLQVKDNGPGITVENREVIFDLFYTTKPAGEGTGVGLALCRSIVERHGGSIMLLDNEVRGATFLVKIPQDRIGAQGHDDET